ncbi:Transposase from transposon Tn916 [Paenibacillus allorhizoplanae]|uniref:Transposase from transposon Tn916 n=1 Tax=Paenibacillus allorhizoplanae TaxID=2905648 RepID=A0ABN8H8F4_9BACL|nr:tyrosine-type recombinase/integrase [Paenibacillus allorhizoplanae]CAH1230743.1 Transposase from transposon Tn916 [Paenibacillus allorhizoplanae]
MAKITKDTTKDYIYEDENAKKNPFWFQVMINGKRVTRRGFKTRGEAKKARAVLIADLSKDIYIEPNKMPFGVYFDTWLSARANIAHSTRKMYESYFRTHIDPLIGDVPLSKLTVTHIDKLIASLREKELGDEMVKRIYATVNASLNAAEKKDLVAKNVASKIEKPTVERKERLVWDIDTVREFFQATKDESRYWIAAYLAVMTGMRQGEILAIRWSDIDLEKGIIQVRRNLIKNLTIFSGLKTEKSRRTITISQQVIAILEEQKQKNELEKQNPKVDYQDNNLVVCSSRGTPATATKVIHAWKTMQTKHKPANAPTITFHDLRHTHASIMLKQGVHPKVISERLGHSTITITLDTYSHLLPNMQEEAAEALEYTIGMQF